jgi:hypothetical protein
MCLRSTKLVDELYDLAKRQAASEDKRETNLSAKAVSLLSVTGLSLTVAFTFGGVLLQRPEYLAALGRARVPLVVAPYALALIAGMAASWFALRSLLVRSDYRDVAEEDVFGKELDGADEKADDGLPVYRRFLTVHLWLIAQETSKIHDQKATQIARGQRCFFAFLLLLVPIGGAMTYSLLVAKQPAPAPPPVAVTCVPEQKVPPPAPPPAPKPANETAKPPPTSVPTSGQRIQGNTRGSRTVPAPRGGKGKT